MLSRTLSLATVTLLIGCFAAASAWAQATNLEAGKSPSQIFAGTCNACHKSPRGLLKTVPAGSLPGFLRQHYTTSSEMASLLSAFLVSNGATDTRYVGAQPKPAKDAKSDAAPSGGHSPKKKLVATWRFSPSRSKRMISTRGPSSSYERCCKIPSFSIVSKSARPSLVKPGCSS